MEEISLRGRLREMMSSYYFNFQTQNQSHSPVIWPSGWEDNGELETGLRREKSHARVSVYLLVLVCCCVAGGYEKREIHSLLCLSHSATVLLAERSRFPSMRKTEERAADLFLFQKSENDNEKKTFCPL